MLGVSRASLYRSKARRRSWSVKRDGDLEERLQYWAGQYPGFGYAKITALLRRRDGFQVNRKRVYRLMKEWGLLKARCACASIAHDGHFELPDGPNQLWQVDLSKVWTEESGWTSLIAIIDVYDRFLVAHGLRLRARAAEAAEILDQALNRSFPDGARGKDLCVMSDQGSCFTGHAFVRTIATLGIKQRLTRRRMPEHNAFIESFFAQLKREEVWPKEYRTI